MYSGGGVHNAGCEIASSTQRNMDSGSAPLMMLLPTSMVSGLSVTSRKVIFGMRNIEHSSWTVPLSVKTASEFFSSFTKSKNPSGSRRRIRSGDGSIPKFCFFSRVRGCTLIRISLENL
jgi:hypothetical protein